MASRHSGTVRDTGWWSAAACAVGLHAVVVILLIVGFSFTSRVPSVHVPLKATVIREPAAEVKERERQKQEEEKKQQHAREKQKQDEEKKERDREKERLEEEQRRKEAEKKRETARQLKEEEQQRQKQAEAEKRKREDERKKEQKLKQQQAEQAMREQLAEEEKSRQTVRDARMASEIDKYKAAIQQRISQKWEGVKPKGMESKVRVRLLPGGEVIQVTIVRSSGNAAFDHGVEQAIHKGSPLPVPVDQDLFNREFREFDFVFRPIE